MCGERTIAVSEVQPLNMSSSMLATLSAGIRTDASEVHPSNVELPIATTESGMWMAARRVQLIKTSPEIRCRVSGSDTDTRWLFRAKVVMGSWVRLDGTTTELRLDDSNTEAPKNVNEVEKVTDRSPEVSANARSPIRATRSGMVIEVIPEFRNAPDPISTSADGRLIVVRRLFRKNALGRMMVMALGSVATDSRTQFRHMLVGISVTPFPIRSVVSCWQLKKTEAPRWDTAFGTETTVRAVCEKAPLSIRVSDAGSVSVCSEMHPTNAEALIVVTVFAMVTLRRLVHDWNEEVPTTTTPVVSVSVTSSVHCCHPLA